MVLHFSMLNGEEQKKKNPKFMRLQAKDESKSEKNAIETRKKEREKTKNSLDIIHFSTYMCICVYAIILKIEYKAAEVLVLTTDISALLIFPLCE